MAMLNLWTNHVRIVGEVYIAPVDKWLRECRTSRDFPGLVCLAVVMLTETMTVSSYSSSCKEYCY